MAIVEPLSIAIRDNGSGSIRLSLRGDLDLATTSAFVDGLAQACEAQPSELLLDFTDLRFGDWSGIRQCILAAEGCAAAGIKLKILGADERIRRVFEMVGLGERFDWEAE